MTYPPPLLSWVEQVSRHLPQLTRSQAQVLAWYSFAATVIQSCGLSSVTCFLAGLLERSENTMRQRLREALYDAADKRGRQRREIDVRDCFAPLLSWVIALGRSPDERLWLALDATTLRQTFTVLSVSVLLGRVAIPVAWKIVPATASGAWKPHWVGLLAALRPVCTDLDVIVLTDRGLYAKWLYNAIIDNGWRPLMRINAQGNIYLPDTGQRLSLLELQKQCRGHVWQGRVRCFAGQQQLNCTLLVQWDVAQKAAWLLVTDLPPTHSSSSWYALRMHIELGFRALKSGGFHWERTRMTDPARAERLWLVLALASLRVALLVPTEDQDALPSRTRYPALNLFKRGMIRQLAALIRQAEAPVFQLPFAALPPPPRLSFLAQLDTYP